MSRTSAREEFYVDDNSFLHPNLMTLKADISKTSRGRYIFRFIFMCGNSKCTCIQKIKKKISDDVNSIDLALRKLSFISVVLKFSVGAKECQIINGRLRECHNEIK